LGSLLLYQIFEKKKKKKLIPPSKQKITYSPESIKISFVLGKNLFNSLQMQSPAPEVRGGALNLSKNFSALRRNTGDEFVPLSNAPQKKFQRTFTLALPNLIHKARTCLPKARRKRKGI
jgi:hypothetical protein